MLRTLGRNGLLERSITTCRHSNTSFVQGRYGSVALKPAPQAFTQLRLLATTPQTKPSPSTSKTPVPIPTALPPRKPKVDLKPAPVKPSAAKTTPSAQAIKSQATPNPHAPLELLPESVSSPPSVSTFESASSTESSSSTLKITESVSEAKRDIQKAEEQGVLPPPPANAGRVRQLWHYGKELFKFYWKGLKMINTHRIQVAQIRQRVKEGGQPISRAEYRFIKTYKEDVLKLVPFLLIVVVMEELIPLIALYVPGMLPSTTIFASQLKRIEGKAQEKQAMFAARRTVFDRIVQAGQLVENGGRGKVVGLGQLRALGEDGTKVICGMLRLAAWGPAPMQLWRIDRHLKHIAKDDELLTNEDLGRRLRDEEIAKALDERGIIATKLSHEQARIQLHTWLTNVSFGPNDTHAVARRIYAVAKANNA